MNLPSFVSNPRAALTTLGFTALTLLNGCATTGEPPSPTSPSPAPSSTTATTTYTTRYTYNADGALTGVTTQVNQNKPVTTYVTWDNFTPDSTNPAQGTVTSGNGNVSGYGSTPGQSFTTQYDFDQRNRLTHYTQDSTAVVYTYHPSSTLASSTLSTGDALRFYYGTGALPRITNIRQSSTGLSSGRMGPLRYLSNNTTQVLLQPRKDVSGVYDASTKTLTPYSYDPYGGPPTETSPQKSKAETDAASYDLSQNPFRFAGEYQDPIWQGLYLRARWYSPELQMFLSRDPRKNLNRFGYTDGNPITRVDPTGENWLAHNIVRPLESGPRWWALTKEFLTAPALGIVGIFAEPKKWWDNPVNPIEMVAFLYLGVAAEGFMGLWAVDDMIGSSLGSGVVRLEVDVGLGAAQWAVTSAMNDSWSGRSFADTMAMAAGMIFYGRGVLGFGYRPFNVSGADLVTTLRNANLTDDEYMVFREKENLKANGDIGRSPRNNATPLGDLLNLGPYHERVIIATRDYDTYGNRTEEYHIMENVGYQKTITGRGANTWDNLQGNAATEDIKRYQYVGKFTRHTTEIWNYRYNGLFLNQNGWDNRVWGRGPRQLAFNNCHAFANAVVRRLSFSYTDWPADDDDE